MPDGSRRAPDSARALPNALLTMREWRMPPKKRRYSHSAAPRICLLRKTPLRLPEAALVIQSQSRPAPRAHLYLAPSTATGISVE
jgi:hypothetical protein